MSLPGTIWGAHKFQNLGFVRLFVKPLVLICMADLLGEKNTVLFLISRLIMATEHYVLMHVAPEMEMFIVQANIITTPT